MENSFPTSNCKLCTFATSSTEVEGNHIIFHSIQEYRGLNGDKIRKVLKLITENTIVSINDFEPLANKIILVMGGQEKFALINCTEVVET